MKLPKLHLRDLFWLVLVCAFVVAWWLERRKLIADFASERTELTGRIEDLEKLLEWEREVVNGNLKLQLMNIRTAHSLLRYPKTQEEIESEGEGGD